MVNALRLVPKRSSRALLLALTLATSACTQTPRLAGAPPTASKSEAERETASRDWAEYQWQRRVNPTTGTIDSEWYRSAERHLQQMPRYSTVLGRELGEPQQAKAAARWSSLGPTNVAGRMRALVFDPRNANRMIVGGVSGGLWETLNGGTNWQLLNDQTGNVNIGAIAIDARAPDTLFVGTGELYRNNAQPYAAMWGQGIYRSRDGGRTLVALTATENDNFRYVADILISRHDPNRLYAATNTGVWRSRDAGASWQQTLRPSNPQGALLYEGCHDLQEIAEGDTDVILVSCASRSPDDRYYLPGTIFPPGCANGAAPCPAAIYRNADANQSDTWQIVLSETEMGRTQMDASKSNPQIVYALSASIDPGPDRSGDRIGDYDNGLHALFRSNDGGRTWTAQVRNTSGDLLSTYLLSYGDGFDWRVCNQAADYYSAGWYNMALAVDPIDPNIVWAGGMELYRSDNGGVTFGKASYWKPFRDPSGTYGNQIYGVHADQHLLRFHPDFDGVQNRTLYTLNDGGIARTVNARGTVNRAANASCLPQNGMVSWEEITSGLVTGQYYTGTTTRNGSKIMGGLQDNGTQLTLSPPTWNHIFGGDGASVAIDPRNSNVLYVSYQYVNLRRSTDGGQTFTRATNGIQDNTVFIVPYVLDQNAPDRLWLGGTAMWRSNDQGRNWTRASAYFGNGFGHRTTAIAVAPGNSNRVLAGNEVAIYRQNAAISANSNTVWQSSSPRTGWVSSLVFDPGDANIAYATYSSFGGKHVYKSTDAGASWTAIDGTGATALPDVPVHTLAVDPSNRQRLFVGTDLGVFVSVDGGANWASEHNGFAKVITEQLAIADQENPPSLYAFTYGRGVWKAPLSDFDGLADYEIDSRISGSFYDPSQDGHGFTVHANQIGGARTLTAIWYVYQDGQPIWLYGFGEYSGNSATLTLYANTGAQFPPAFQPGQVQTSLWGTARLRFDDLNNGRVDWTSSVPGFSNGGMNLQRLTQPDRSPGSATILGSCTSGAWFAPGQDGHGLVFEYLGGGRAAASWYAFVNGQPAWFNGVGMLSGNSVEIAAFSASGPDFPPDYRPADLQRQGWGNLSFELLGDNAARVTWQSTQPGFGSGSLDLVQLWRLDGLTCTP